MSLTKVKWPMATGNQLELTPEFDLFPTTEIWAFRNLDGTVPIYKLSSHSPAVSGYGGSDLFQMQKMAIYTHNGAGGTNKRFDLDANATNATTIFSNSKAFIITNSTNPNACLMVGVDYAGYDAANNIFDPTDCSTFFGVTTGPSAIFRKDGSNKDIVILENRNGVTGDQANLAFALDGTDGNERQFGYIKMTGIDQADPNYQGQLDFYTRFQSTYQQRLSLTRDRVTVGGNSNDAGHSGAALEICARDAAEGQILVRGTDNTQTNNSFRFYHCTGTFGNAAENVLRVATSTTTGRSINAGGTINASGSDYAEYMEKAGDFTISKGDICGIDTNGRLTNVFADAVSFVVKSTDPSYVGNDAWAHDLDEPVEPVFNYAEYSGSENPGPKPVMDDIPTSELTDEAVTNAQEEYQQKLSEWISLKERFDADRSAYDAAKASAKANFDANEYTRYQEQLTNFNQLHENARSRMDRIAFCGQVPVNLTGASVGDYIVPIESSGLIIGQSVTNPTLEQYMMAVGKVIAIEDDGRAKIIVKIS